MKIRRVLKYLHELLQDWKIEPKDWIFAAQYAHRLLGYKVMVREGHINLIVNKSKIPWRIDDELETHAPVGTVFLEQYERFMKRTNFEFDFIPVPREEFSQRLKYSVKYQIFSGIRINLQTPWGDLIELDNILSKCTSNGWGEEKGYRIFPHLENMKRAALKKGEVRLAKAYENLAKKYNHFKNRKSIGEVSKHIQKDNSFSGIVASKGKARGVVNIVLNPEITKRFVKGEILVTTMTSPKFTPFFGKARAIVTDEGGLLSHAAIVAREMKIPCLVGTKIATKVLEDGNLIEVDAYKGIVRKLDK